MVQVKNCVRCGHEWVARQLSSEPRRCPRCQSPNWWRSRVYKTVEERSEQVVKKLNENKRIYEFYDLEIGQSVKFDFKKGAQVNFNRVRALQAYEKRSGRKHYWDAGRRELKRIA